MKLNELRTAIKGLICLGCGKRPQSPFYDQCIGCGKTGYEQSRGWVQSVIHRTDV